MAKTNQVTNDAERDEMQSRIIKASVLIADPLLEPAEKSRYMAAYDEMVSIMKAYDRAEYCKKFPGVRAIYEQLGWIVGAGNTETRDTSAHDAIKSDAAVKKSNGESQKEPVSPVVDEYGGAEWL